MRKGKQLVICPTCGNAFPIETIIDHITTHFAAKNKQRVEIKNGSAGV